MGNVSATEAASALTVSLGTGQQGHRSPSQPN